jgi:hypothetical protein
MIKKSLHAKYFFALACLIINFEQTQTLNLKDAVTTSADAAANDLYEEQLVSALAQIFKTFKYECERDYKTLSGEIALGAVGVGEFSEEKFENFNTFVAEKLKKFKENMESISLTAMASYNNFLIKQDRYSLSGKDETAQNLQESIRIIKEETQEKVDFFITAMLAGGTLGDFSEQLASEVLLFDAESRAAFLEKQAKATVKITRTFWDKLKLYMEKLGPILEKQFVEDLGKTIGVVLEVQLGKLGNLVAEFAGELTALLSDYVKEKATALLAEIGKKLTPEIEKLLEKIMPVLEPMLKLIGKKLENASLELLDELVKQLIRDSFKSEHDFKDVSVRTGAELCEAEKEFLKLRMEKTNLVLKESFGISVPLKIAFMSSGGGLRATFGYLGFAIAAEEAKMWDTALYSVGLSGSTWKVMPYSYACAKEGTTLKEYRDYLIDTDRFSAEFPNFSGGELGGLAIWLIKEYGYELPFSSADLYGMIPGHGCIMGDKQTSIRISEMTDEIKKGLCPLPLCAGIYYAGNERTNTSADNEEKIDSKASEEKRVISDKELDKLLDEITEDFKESYVSDDDLDAILDQAAKELDNDSDLDALLNDAVKEVDEDDLDTLLDDAAQEVDEDDLDALLNDSLNEIDQNGRQLGKLGKDETAVKESDTENVYEMVKEALSGTKKENEKYTKQTQYNWLEWSPFEVGGPDLGFVPVWAWGASFNNGKPLDSFKGRTPEYILSNLLGAFGSAYSVTANDVIDRVPEKVPKHLFDILGTPVQLPIGEWIATYFDTMGIEASEARLLAPIYPNFSRGLSTSSLKDAETIEVLDAGMDSNMPFPLLMNRDERKMDVIFLFHADPGTVVIFETIVKHFKRKGIAYPAAFDKVTEAELASKPMTIFNDPRENDYVETLPTFIYLPFLNCPEHAKNTFNFAFTGDQIAETVTAAEEMFTSQVGEITQVLQEVAKKKGDTSVVITPLPTESEALEIKQLGTVAAPVVVDEPSSEVAPTATNNSKTSDQNTIFDQLIASGDVVIPGANSTNKTTGSVDSLLSILNSIKNDLAKAV